MRDCERHDRQLWTAPSMAACSGAARAGMHVAFASRDHVRRGAACRQFSSARGCGELPGRELCNLYGPTEATIDVT